jgi:hypothetical protein
MISLVLALAVQVGLTVPGYTAYSAPPPDSLRMDESKGFIDWRDPETAVVWYGKITDPGELWATVKLEASRPLAEAYLLRVDRRNYECASDKLGMISFGPISIQKAGYKSFELRAKGKKGDFLGLPLSLTLTGKPVIGAEFNMKPRRNAPSVHLGYPIAEGAKVTRFYAEVEPKEDPVSTYYEVCGFKRGYFGIQVNSPSERRIIFSVWDAGNEAVDRSKVGNENRVKLLEKGDGVFASDFGNEGTGGHSHMIYPWKKGQTYRLLTTATPVGDATEYAGYFYFPERKSWGLIAKFRAPKDGGYLRGLYSFNENFWGDNGNLKRAAIFKNQWVQFEGGTWRELTQARFTCDATGKNDRFDYLAKPVGDGFWLQNGGYEDNGIRYGNLLNRAPAGKQPRDVR